ncbi:MAG: T9SS type A sorting domain-containing protein [Ignavibacteriales bacterium]|nr:T9SS type A sorting domain-containing protein [Ignavibacteriales bacterium]
MKTICRISFFFFLVTQICFAQWCLNQSFTNLNLKNACYSSDGNIFIVGELGSIYLSSDNGCTWQSNYIPNTGNLNSLIIIDNEFGYIVGDYGKIFRTDFSSMQLEDISISELFHFRDVAFKDNENGVLVGTKQVRIDGRTYYLPSIHLTTDAGLSWTEKCFDVRGKLNSVSYFDEENIITVGDSGKILISNDNGINWVPLVFGISANLQEVKFCPDGIGIIIGENGTIILSFDGWQSWSIINVPAYYHIKSVCSKDIYQLVAAGHMRVRIDGRDFNVATIFSSNDGGINWNESFISQRGSYNSISFCNPNLAIAVGDSGLFSMYESPNALEDNNLTLSDFSLKQNFPNPFNSTCAIIYSIPKSSQVSLKIFNTIGEEIETLVNGEKPIGTYEVNWNAENIPSGVYFYQLKAGDFTQTRKMILLR